MIETLKMLEDPIVLFFGCYAVFCIVLMCMKEK